MRFRVFRKLSDNGAIDFDDIDSDYYPYVEDGGLIFEESGGLATAYAKGVWKSVEKVSN